MIKGNFAFKTDMGLVRLSNEDQAYGGINSHGKIMLVVLDGMKGEKHGDIASKLAFEVIKDCFSSFKPSFFNSDRRFIKKSLKKANSKVFKAAIENPSFKGMGTTVTICLISDDFITVGQIGDSRCYMLKGNELVQISEDQTYVSFLYRSGQIKKEDMLTHPKRHVLLNALGIYPSLSIDIKTIGYHKESLLLCTDGLYNNVTHKDIASLIKTDDNCVQKIESLISLANSNGGSDNIGIVYWESK